MRRNPPNTRLLHAVRLMLSDPWQVVGSAALIVSVLAVAMLFAHARTLNAHSGKHAHDPNLVSIASPNGTTNAPDPVASPTPSPAPSASAAPRTQPLTGAQAAPPSARATARPRPTATPAATNPAPVDSPPKAVLIVTVSGTSISADASGSSDTDSTGIASYLFQFGDGTTAGPGAASVVTHAYPGASSYTVTVFVTDSAGLVSSATKTVTVGP